MLGKCAETVPHVAYFVDVVCIHLSAYGMHGIYYIKCTIIHGLIYTIEVNQR